MAHPDPAVRRDGLEKFEVLCEVTTRLRAGLTGAKLIDEGERGIGGQQTQAGRSCLNFPNPRPLPERN